MTEHKQVPGTIEEYDVPLVSHTYDHVNEKQYKHEAAISFREAVYSDGEYYFGTIETTHFFIDFFHYRPMNHNPGYRSAYATMSYYLLRQWMENVRQMWIQELLKQFPQTSPYDHQGQPVTEGTQEEQIKAFQLFTDAKPKERDLEKARDLAAEKNLPKVKVRTNQTDNPKEMGGN